MEFKFHKVIDYLYIYIAENSSNPNAQIPSERKLSSTLNVSRTTVKYAIDKLVEKRVLYKVHGKGTFVKPNERSSTINIAKYTPDAFNLNARSIGVEPQSHVISFKLVYDLECMNSLFELDNDHYYELIRLRSINQTPFSVEKSYFPFNYFSDANRFNFSNYSLYDYMERKGKRPLIFNKEIEMIIENKYNKLLNIKYDTPIFLSKYIGKDDSQSIVEYTETYTNPQYVEYSFQV